MKLTGLEGDSGRACANWALGLVTALSYQSSWKTDAAHTEE